MSWEILDFEIDAFIGQKMAEADIITLDSDEEDTISNTADQYLSNGSNGAGVTIKRIPTAPKVIPRVSGMVSGPGRPGPSGRKPQVPKKPGVFPPFALFSQEKRIEILNEQPSVSFGEVGRKLGEMWHGLSEVEKEEYRRRAREISEKKMSEYQETLRKLPPQQRQLAISQANQPKKRTKTHGYAIFSAEMRKNLGNAMSPQETANVIAESWRSASPAVRRDYEDRAARINAVQQRRTQPPPSLANRQPVNPPPQTFPNHFNNSSHSGLRISSVSSLSPQAKRRPVASSPSRPAPPPPGPKLPSGITISRVEPEVSIVDEQPSVPPAPAAVVKANFANRGRPGMRRPTLSPAAQAAMRVRAQLRNNQQVSSSQSIAVGNGHHRGGLVNPRGRPYLDSRGAPVYRMAQPGLKRIAGRGAGMIGPAPKMPRMNLPRVEQRLCRSCGLVGPVGCKLDERPEVLQNLSELTLTPIDLVKDQVEGYPAEICRRCLSSITNLTIFKKTFCDGQEKLKARVRPPPMLPLPPDLAASGSDITAPTEGADPSTDSSPSVSMGQEESILPDLDLDMDFGENPANVPQPVNIKEEKIRVITPSMEKIRIKSEVSKPMCSENIVEGGSEEKLVLSKPKEENGDGVQKIEKTVDDDDENITEKKADLEMTTENEFKDKEKEDLRPSNEEEKRTGNFPLSRDPLCSENTVEEKLVITKSKEVKEIEKPVDHDENTVENNEEATENDANGDEKMAAEENSPPVTTAATEDPLTCNSDDAMQEERVKIPKENSTPEQVQDDSSCPQMLGEDDGSNGQEDSNLSGGDFAMQITEENNSAAEEDFEEPQKMVADHSSSFTTEEDNTVATGDDNNDESFVNCMDDDNADQTSTNQTASDADVHNDIGDPFETQASQEAVQQLQGDDNDDDAFMPPQDNDKEETVCL